MDFNVGDLDRVKTKKKSKKSGDNECGCSVTVDIDDDDTGDAVSNRILSLDMSDNLDANHSPTYGEDFLHFIPETPSPVFSRKLKKNVSTSSNDACRSKYVSKLESKKSKNEIGASTSRGKSLVLDNKDHEVCMESAAIVLKTIGNKYGFQPGSSKSVQPDVEKQNGDNISEEQRKRKIALQRIKVMREKRKARTEATPEKQNVSNKFPRYNSGYLGWPSESESDSHSDSDSDDFFTLRSALSKHKDASNPDVHVQDFPFKPKGGHANSVSPKAKANSVSQKKAKQRNEGQDVRLEMNRSSGTKNNNVTCDKNGKLVISDQPSSCLYKSNIGNNADPGLFTNMQMSTAANGAIPKNRTAHKQHNSKNSSKLSNSSRTQSSTTINSTLYTSPHVHHANKQASKYKTNSSPSLMLPSKSPSRGTSMQWQTPPSQFISNPRQGEEPVLDIQSSDTSNSSTSVSDSSPRTASPDLILLGITPPEPSPRQRTGKRQRTGTRAADLRKHRNVRHGSTSRGGNNTTSHVDNDAVQVIEQITNDEDYARRLQEEMDKEFAYSLVQSQNFNPQHVSSANSDFHAPDPTYGHNLDFVHVNNLNFGPHNWHSPPRRRAAHNARSSAASRNRRGNGDVYIPDIDMIDNDMNLNVNYGVNLLNGRYQRPRTGLEMVESHLIALLEDNSPRRGRRGGNRRNVRYNGIGFYPPPADGNDYDTLLQLAEELGDVRQKGICERQISRLPVKKYRKCDKSSEVEIDECSICMCEYEEEENVRILTCFHRFHAGCVDKWLQGNASCPVCRVEVKLE